MKITHYPPLTITLDNNDTNHEREPKPHTNCLFINDNSELKTENEIKIEADINLDDIQTDNTIFATELDILENVNNKKHIKEEKKIASENEINNHQQTKKRKKKSDQHTSKKIKLSAREITTDEPCTSKVLEGTTSVEQLSEKHVSKRTHKRTSEEPNEVFSDDFDDRSDYDNTDSDYETNVASKFYLKKKN